MFLEELPHGSEVKYLPAVQEVQEMQVRSLGQEDPLEEEMATHSNILAWKLPWTEEPGGLQSIGSQIVMVFLELRQGIQAASCVGPGKSNLPFELRRKAGDCSRVTAGPIDLI